MAKCRNNRAARALFIENGMPHQSYKLSNRRSVFVGRGIKSVSVKPSVRQKRARMHAYDLNGIVDCDCRNYI